jgi:hypothetical protein
MMSQIANLPRKTPVPECKYSEYATNRVFTAGNKEMITVILNNYTKHSLHVYIIERRQRIFAAHCNTIMGRPTNMPGKADLATNCY